MLLVRESHKIPIILYIRIILKWTEHVEVGRNIKIAVEKNSNEENKGSIQKM